jgi:ribosomal protein S18 acetylase RimI-like enzyme
MSNELLSRLEDHVRAAAGRTRAAVDVGPFRLFIARDTDLAYLNYAVPMDEPADWLPGIAALETAARDRGRVPRLEFFAERWPTLAPALDRAGFHCDLAAPVMTATALPVDIPPLPPGFAVRHLDPADPDGIFDGYIKAGYDSYGMAPPEPDPARIADLRRDLSTGALCAGFVEAADGAVATVASILTADGIGELAGVGTRREWRRQGLAHALCRDLLRAFFADGGELAWLSAGDEGASRLYRRLGFAEIGRQLNYSRHA